jgi:polar amino acid transport system ATP-binding protein
MTMIVVTHELGFAREVSHRTAFMDQGQLVEIGDSRSVLASPQQARTREFISAVHK